MPIKVNPARIANLAVERRDKEPSGLAAPLDVALGVAASVAKRHGGEVQLRSSGHGRLLVELRFPLPVPPA